MIIKVDSAHQRGKQMDQEWFTQQTDEELKKTFPKKPQPPELPLPIDFDDTCKNAICEDVTLERLHCYYCVTPAPYATFQCPKCLRRLYLFDAPETPLLLWSNTVRKSGQTFAEQIAALIEKRERHWQTKKRRYGRRTEEKP